MRISVLFSDRKMRLAPLVAAIAFVLVLSDAASEASGERHFTGAEAAAVVGRVPRYPRVDTPFRRELPYRASCSGTPRDVASWNAEDGTIPGRVAKFRAAGFVCAVEVGFRGRHDSVSAQVFVFPDERGAKQGFSIIKDQNLHGFFTIKPFPVHGLAAEEIGLHVFNMHDEDTNIAYLWRVGNIVLEADYYPDTVEALRAAPCNRPGATGKCPSSMLSIPRLRGYADEINRRARR